VDAGSAAQAASIRAAVLCTLALSQVARAATADRPPAPTSRAWCSRWWRSSTKRRVERRV